MLKRVSGTRNGLCAALLVFVLVTIVAVVPVSAREYLSVSQAGDPGDGSEVSESGGTVTDPTTNNSQNDGASREAHLILFPLWVNGILLFQIVVLSARRVAGL